MARGPWKIRDIFDGVALRVSWLAEGWAARFRLFLGLHFDLLTEMVGLALKAGHLRNAESPPDALGLFAAERQLERAPGESEAAFRERLANAWEIWGDAGQKGDGGSTELSFAQRALENFTIPGVVSVYYEPQTGWSGPAPDYWSYCWIVVRGAGAAWTFPTCGGLYVCGTTLITCGSSATYDEVQLVRTMVRRLKAGHEVPVFIALDPDARICGTGGTCGVGSAGPVKCIWHLAHYAGLSTNQVTAGGEHRWARGKPALCGALV
jgi:hypothetical protein